MLLRPKRSVTSAHHHTTTLEPDVHRMPHPHTSWLVPNGALVAWLSLLSAHYFVPSTRSAHTATRPALACAPTHDMGWWCAGVAEPLTAVQDALSSSDLASSVVNLGHKCSFAVFAPWFMLSRPNPPPVVRARRSREPLIDAVALG